MVKGHNQLEKSEVQHKYVMDPVISIKNLSYKIWNMLSLNMEEQ